MEQSTSWVINSSSPTQEIVRLLWNSKVYYRVHASPPVGTTISDNDPVHILTPYFLRIYNLNYFVIPSFWVTVYIHSSVFSCVYMPRPSHSPWFYEASNKQFFSSSLLLPLSLSLSLVLVKNVPVLPSTDFSNTPHVTCAHVYPSRQETKFHTHTKHKVRL
jgi:hypothetical protein